MSACCCGVVFLVIFFLSSQATLLTIYVNLLVVWTLQSLARLLQVLVSGDVIRLRTVNEPNHDGWTPLHACCHSPECTDAAILLIDEIVRTDGAKGLDLKTIRGPGSFCGGSSPLHIASAYGMSTVVMHLCEVSMLCALLRNSILIFLICLVVSAWRKPKYHKLYAMDTATRRVSPGPP